MRNLLLIAAGVVVAAIAWRQAPPLDELLATRPPPKPIVFDNGSVRDLRLPPPASALSAARHAAAPPGGLRKCVRGSETTYTNFSCAAGFTERAVSSDRMTFVAGHAAPEPAAAPARRSSSLRNALDVSGNDEFRRRVVERAVDGR